MVTLPVVTLPAPNAAARRTSPLPVRSASRPKRRPARWALAVLVGLLALLAVLPAILSTPPEPTAETPASASDEPAPVEGCPRAASADAPIDRVAGADRYATAACAAAASFPGGAEHAVLARGDAAGDLADALAGAVLADAVDGPVLLTAPATLPGPTASELERLAVQRVTVLGGPDAVSPGAAAEVEARGIQVDRVAGPDRFTTAARVAERADAGPAAFVVNGLRPADSLVAAAPAARAGAQLLLTTRDHVPQATASALEGAGEVTVVGGHDVVSAPVAGHLGALAGAEPRRVAGGDRAATAASVARAFPAGERAHVAVAFDEHLVDAVTAGWAAARPGGGPVLFSGRHAPGRATDRWLRLGGLGAGDAPVRLVGGTAVLSDQLVAALEDRYAEAAAGGPAPQLRGTWAHLFDDDLKSTAGIHRVLDEAARAGANTVIVQVARRQDAYYDSDVLPRTPDPELTAGLDLLDELVPAAHDRGLEVHAWVSVLQAYHEDYDELTLPPDHVWRRHGPGSSDPWLSRRADGATSTYLDPGVPGVQDHVAAVMREIAERSDVDAVHTDYLRYTGNGDWGYHPTSLERFREQTGATGTPPPDGPRWSDWRRAQTADLARRVFLEVADADPATAVSMAASTMGPGPAHAGGYENTRTYSWVFQDWPAWLAEGSVDVAVPMNYFREANPEHRAWFDDWGTFERDLAHDGVLAVGQGGYLNAVTESLAQIDRASARSDGVVLFSHQQNVRSEAGPPQALLTRLGATRWSEPAPPPPLPDRPAGGHLLVAAADGAAVTATPATGDGEAATRRADATGHAGLMWLAPGTWTVDAAGHLPATATVERGEVTRVELTPAR